MSASLVGSEMCIRDRLSARHELELRAVSACPSRLPMGIWRLRGLPHSAVSYTHLTLPTICSV
eukprot:11538909-Alexandrium_andersonii.AAC.1